MKSRIVIFVVSAVCALSAFGCGVPKKITWLPDSSGFVYVRNDGTLMRFDVKDGKQHEIVKTKTAAPQIPAVSPGGKRLAVVNVELGETEDVISVTIYGMDGKTLFTSKTLTLPGGRKKGESPSPTSGAFWSADKTHLLVTFSTATKGMQSAVYNTKTGTLALLTAVKPFYAFDYIVSLPWIRPDGKGFLAQPAEKPSGGDNNFLFVEWSGKQHVLVADKSYRDFMKRNKDQSDVPGESDLAQMKRQGLLPMPVGRWEKQVVVIPIGTGEVRIDTKKRRISFHENKTIARRRAALAKQNIYRDEPLAGGRYRVRVRLREQDGKNGKMQFELFDAVTKTSASLTGFVYGFPGGMIAPSPDRKHIAILYSERGPTTKGRADYIVRVIRSDGKIVSTFDIK